MSSKLDSLQALIKTLRDEKKGCAWTREQNWKSLVAHTIEEAYEIADAVEQDDAGALKDELGDMLYHIIFYAQIAEEQQLFNFEDVAEAMLIKHQSRMPPKSSSPHSAKDTDKHWEKAKLKNLSKQKSLLDDITTAIPALMRAKKLQKRAASVGFDWPDIAPVFDKCQEEIAELKKALKGEPNNPDIQAELGDLLFSCVNLARHLDISPEIALRECNQKFTKRFQYIEQALANKNHHFAEATLDQLEKIWQEAKIKVD